MTLLANQTVDLGVHIVCDVDDFGVALIGTLGQNHLNKLCDNVDVRVLEATLLQRAHPAVSARRVRDGIAGCGRLLQKIAADRTQPTGVWKVCQFAPFQVAPRWSAPAASR